MSLRVPPAPPLSQTAPPSFLFRAPFSRCCPASPRAVLQLSRAADSAARGHGRPPPVVLYSCLPPLSSWAAPVALFRPPVACHGQSLSAAFLLRPCAPP